MRGPLVAIAGLTIGCFPTHTLVQPGIEFRVTSSDGSPIQDATVTLARYSEWSVQTEHLVSLATDVSGSASFSAERKWHLRIAAPDLGGPIYSWSWCIEAEGFMAVFQNDLRSSAYSSVQEVTLEQAESAYHCHWDCHPCGFDSVSE